MFVIGNFIGALAAVLGSLISVVYWLVLIRAVISWVSPDPFNPIVQFLYTVTDPILEPIRKVLPVSWRTGIDLSPIIAFFLLIFIKSFLVGTLVDISLRLR